MQKYTDTLKIILILITGVELSAVSETRYVYPVSGVRLRETPAITGKFLALVPFNTELQITTCGERVKIDPLEVDGMWCKTSFDGKEGWVYSSFLGKRRIPYDLTGFAKSKSNIAKLWHDFLADCEDGKYQITKLLGKVKSIEVSKANRIPCVLRVRNGVLTAGCGEDQMGAEISISGSELQMKEVYSNHSQPDGSKKIFNCKITIFALIEGTALEKDFTRMTCEEK